MNIILLFYLQFILITISLGEKIEYNRYIYKNLKKK
jgi:hypothetical protein